MLSEEDLSHYSTFYTICEGSITEENALLLCRNCARAVAELHKIGIVHGDLATENILVHPESMDVKIIDFDLSSEVGN